jgi:ABC-type lipoprotein export system ATPase subunit
MPIAARHVTHRYRKHADPVLTDVDLEIGDGITVALMGPSGSGKSTLLGILGGLLAPSQGLVEVDGHRLSERTADRARLFSWVFQTVNALGRRTALDNVCAPLLAQGHRRQEAETECRQILETVGLGHRVEATAASLSGGELQRVCIARALATSPRFLLADEPTGQLDHRTSIQVLDALWAARTDSTTLVIATHDHEVAQRCERIIHLVDGRPQ